MAWTMPETMTANTGKVSREAIAHQKKPQVATTAALRESGLLRASKAWKCAELALLSLLPEIAIMFWITTSSIISCPFLVGTGSLDMTGMFYVVLSQVGMKASSLFFQIH